MNTSIVVRGELWGLFAFHHYRPIRVSPDRRSICELFTSFISLHIQQRLEKSALSRRRRTASALRKLRKSEEKDFENLFRQGTDPFLEVINADGAALVEDDRIIGVQTIPREDVIRAICRVCDDDITTINSLRATPGIPLVDSHIAGAFVLKFKLISGSYIVFFRKEIRTNVRWGGMPEKRIEFGPNGPRLHPRVSFDEYLESVAGKCKTWTQPEVAAALEFRETLREIALRTTDLAKGEWERQKKHQDLLIAELNHRVKNILALIRSIARQTKQSSTSLEQYAISLESRIQALSTAHDMIGDSGLQWARLKELLQAELQPYLTTGKKVEMSWPSVAVRGDAAPVLSLVIHELTSNAVKHGALSEHGDKLWITWAEEAGGLALQWSERVTKRIGPPKRRGFGRSLIERAIPHQCGGECTLEFKEDGLHVSFWLPSDAITRVESRAQPKSTRPPRARIEAQTVISQSVLVVEDNMALAMELEHLLEGLGFSDVLSCGNLESARDAIARSPPDFALLDIDLSGSTSAGLAQELQHAGVPTIFVTGYDSKFPLPSSLSEVPRLRKPVDETKLSQAINEVCGVHNEKNPDP